MFKGNSKLGIDLTKEEQRYVLSAFIHRFTKEHIPAWAQVQLNDGVPFEVQFDSDKDWLEHTYFMVTKDGKLDKRSTSCFSSPTWPDREEVAL